MDFGSALDALKQGCKVHREGWNGKGMWVAYEDTTRWTTSNMQPFLYMKAANGTYVPWLASQTDLLADDWLIALEAS